MATKDTTTEKKRNRYIYGPTQEAKDRPRRTIVDGKVVGIGGSIEVTPTPPKLPRRIKEASAAQYRKLYERGMVELVQRTEND